MVHAARADLRAHSMSHKLLCLWIDHAILFSNQEPGWLRSPSWRRRDLLNALNRNWALHCGQDSGLVGRSLVGDRTAKSVFRHPDKTVFVRAQLRRFRMGLVAVKHLRDGLTFIGRESCDINKRFDSLLAYHSNHSPSVSVADQDNRASRSFECTSQCGSVVAQRRKRNRSANDLKTLAF